MKVARREFLRSAAALGVVNLIDARVLYGSTAPSNRLTRALVGFGLAARAFPHLRDRASTLKAIAEVDGERLESAAKAAERQGWGKVRAVRDFRELLSDPGIDLVHLAVPTHWHGAMAALSLAAGKAVWCETPLARTFGEARRLWELSERSGVPLRVTGDLRREGALFGFGTTVAPLRRLVAGGVLGKRIRCTVGRAQGFDWRFLQSAALKAGAAEPVPDSLDWEAWLGPAVRHAYSREFCRGGYRGWWEFDSGALGDQAQRFLEPLLYVLGKDLELPVEVDYTGARQHPELVGRFGSVTLVYADGTEIVLDGDGTAAHSPLLAGSEAAVWPVGDEEGNVRAWVEDAAAAGAVCRLTSAAGEELDAAGVLAELPPEEPTAWAADFATAVRERREFHANARAAFASVVPGQLAAVALRLGRGFRFDPVTMRPVRDEAAARLLYPELREPWASRVAAAGGGA